MFKYFYFFASVALLFSCDGQNSSTSEDLKSPNIIVILADDMGYGDIQVNNPDSKIATPSLNSLANEGARFTDAHSNSAVCTPTRYGLVTGRYAWRTRLKNGVLSGYSNHLIDTARITIASLVKKKGYQTAVIGKWHLGLDYPWIEGVAHGNVDDLNYCAENEIDYTMKVKNGPNELGFDYSFLVPGSLDMSPYVYIENGMATALPDSVSPKISFPAFTRKGEIAPDFTHRTALDKLTQKAVSFINDQAHNGQPFLLYFPLTGPHKPALTAERFVGKSGYGPYGDLVMQVDWTVGQVIDALKKNKIEENTIVMYTSDNGSYMYRIDEDKPDHVDSAIVQGYHVSRRQANYIWRGTKADIYEAGHRVPFIVKWPGKIKGGSINEQTICLTDIFATIAEITNQDYPENAGEDSFSFLQTAFGNQESERPPVIHHSVNGSFSVRYGKWKMIFSDGSGGREQPVGKPFGKPYQLYDLDADPSEKINLIDDQPEVVGILSDYLEQIQANSSKDFKFR